MKSISSWAASLEDKIASEYVDSHYERVIRRSFYYLYFSGHQQLSKWRPGKHTAQYQKCMHLPVRCCVYVRNLDSHS